MTKKAKSDSTTNIQSYQSLLDQASKTKTEMNILYDLYKDRRNQFESLRNQIEAIILNNSGEKIDE